MSATKLILTILLLVFFGYASEAQIIINEISNKNSGQIVDEDNSAEDWIEVLNTSSGSVDLSGYYLSDDSTNLQKWAFPAYQMPAGRHLVVFASDKNRTTPPDTYHWESAVLPQDIFDYLVPTASTPANWMKPDYTPENWKKGKAGFGYGDNDDATIVPTSAMVVYARKSFILPDGFNYAEVALNVDYDDGFVAYLNGVEIGRRFIGGTPSWNSLANATREATMYSGGKPEYIALDTALVRSLLVPGENVFAIEVHNYLTTSGDLSLIPYFSFRIKDPQSFFNPTPSSVLTTNATYLSTNFKIDSKGEKIYLYNANSRTRETVWVKDLSSGWSMGRKTDGAAEWGVFTEPTPGMANTTKAYSTQREPEPGFTLSEGFYSGTQTVKMIPGSTSSQIRYTFDGSEPTTSSYLYSGNPITISSTTTIRATSFSKTDKLPSRSVTNTYFINLQHSIPVLSVSTDNNNLYGSTGIFDNWREEWEKPCYIEYFDANRKKQFEQFTGIQIDGGAGGSRANAQHSFRLEFNNKEYGDGDIDYPLIPDRPARKKYKSVYIRNGSNQWLTFEFKDAMETKMMANQTNNYYSACTPVAVYINGGYFGLYEMREKLNDEFFEENYQAKIDSSFNLLSLSYYYNLVLRALNGSVDNFTNDYNNFLKINRSDAAYLQKADQILDLDYYTDYIIAQSWIADTDWPYNNIKIVKGDFTNNRWRFILQDLEWSLNPNGWTDSGFDHIAYMLGYNESVPYLRFWKELIKNTTYKKRFINRFADIMNTAYLPENTIAVAQKIYDDSYSEMRSEYVRWGGGESQANARMSAYTNNMTIFKSELNKRTAAVRSNIVSNFNLTGTYNLELQVQPANAGVIQINTITPETYPWKGVYFSGNPIRMEAKGTGNYVFDGWEPNTVIKNTANPVIDADVRLSGYKFIAKFRLQRPEKTVTISEINYNSGEDFPAGDWIELFNYGTQSQNLSGWYLSDSDPDHRWMIPGSVVLQPNQRLVLASNLSKFGVAYPAVTNVLGSFGFGLGSVSDSVQLFDATGKLIAGVKYSSQAPWPTEALNQGKTLELVNPDINLSLASNWFAGCLGGSPGTAYQKCGTTLSEEISDNREAHLFPNPASDQINIRLSGALSVPGLNCRIYNLVGKLVQEGTFDGSFQPTIQLSVGHLHDGIYLVQLTNGTTKQSLKFVKRTR